MANSPKKLDGRSKQIRIFKNGKRRCARCLKYKSLDNFYNNRAMKGLKGSYCKSCAKEYLFEKNGGPKPDKLREYQRIYYLKNKERLSEYKKTWSKNNRHKTSASWVVNALIRKEEIIKPDSCEFCGIKGEKIQGHHPDYDFPLTIKWLCKSCHQRIHNKIR